MISNNQSLLFSNQKGIILLIVIIFSKDAFSQGLLIEEQVYKPWTDPSKIEPSKKISPKFDFFTTAKGGSILLYSTPTQKKWFPSSSFDVVFTCTESSLCQKGNISFLRTHIDMAFSNDPYVEEKTFLVQSGSYREYHLPFFTFKLRAFEFWKSDRFYIGLLPFQLSRSTRILDERLNIQANLGMVSLRFGKRHTTNIEGICSLGVMGPGFTSVDYLSGAIPFRGMYIFGFEQGCMLSAGNSKAQAMFSYALQSNIHVGKSGAGNTTSEGAFGALLSESRLTFQAGVWFRAPNILRRAGIAAFSIEIPISLRYHLQRGCLRDQDISVPSCGNNTNAIEIRLPLSFGVSFSSPKDENSLEKLGPLSPPWNPPSPGL